MGIKHVLLVSLIMLISTSLLAQVDFESDTPAPGNLRFTWIHGSVSAMANTDVRIQVHRYNEHTYMLRQNPATHWEAPFMYLLMGNQRAVLLDTGATEEAEYFPLRQVVDGVLQRWAYAQGVDMPELVVMPLGSDQSQNAGIGQFSDRPNTILVTPDADSRGSVLENELLDLGGRVLQVLPTPGLDSAAVSLYDAWAELLFTGNAFYPGRLVIRDFPAYRTSLQALVDLTASQSVSNIFGGRIEMTEHPGLDYRLRANYRPDERVLQLQTQHLESALLAVTLINGATDIRIMDDFILMHGVGRGARDWGYPVFIPEAFQNVNTR
ncbi:MAG: MBL fold metallo-hydrolase [Gammaproteobacteria bacterium]|nr:MBL fold metallo-hydrolase [Gammaproteobacteria bacterium]|tara:strand:- start:918 stop:1889 length:972 start_codon:yes stop_codon:yes gene_type:complete